MRDWQLFLLLTTGIAATLVLIIGFSVRAMRWARKGSPAATVIGWALLLLGAGMNPQPPPQTQIEEQNRETRRKKDAQAGDPPK